jgi:FMN phosphatase YigB (HAD superfamily)
VAILAMMASACRVDVTVDIDVNEDGSGVVAVTMVADAEAVALSPDLPDGLRLADLPAAGWDVTGPEETSGGGLTVNAVKPFESADQLPHILAELAGEGVIFRDIELSLSRSFARTTYEVLGTIDPTPPMATFGDAGLAGLLQGEPLGRDEMTLELETGRFEDSLGLIVSITLPDDIASQTADIDGRTATWTVSYGDAPVAIDAFGNVEDTLPQIWRLVALGAVALLVLVFLLRVIAWVVGILRTPKGRRRRDARRRQQRAASREAEANRPRRRLLRLLIVDAHGVVVRPTEPVGGLLLPIIQAERPDVDPDMVRDRHRKLVLGRSTPEEFWSDVGVGPVAADLETRYLSSFRLVPGLHPFLDRMGSRRLPIAVVGNQPRAWGERLRRMASLEDAVASWLVSGDVGSMLPEPALFEATRRTLSVDLYDVLYLSSVPEFLDAASELGMATAYFAAGPGEVIDTTHTLVRGFDDLLRGGG